MSKPRKPLIAEFLVEVYPDRIEWGGVDALLGWLIGRRPREGFAPHAARLNRLGQPAVIRKGGR